MFKMLVQGPVADSGWAQAAYLALGLHASCSLAGGDSDTVERQGCKRVQGQLSASGSGPCEVLLHHCFHRVEYRPLSFP